MFMWILINRRNIESVIEKVFENHLNYAKSKQKQLKMEVKYTSIK